MFIQTLGNASYVDSERHCVQDVNSAAAGTASSIFYVREGASVGVAVAVGDNHVPSGLGKVVSSRLVVSKEFVETQPLGCIAWIFP